MGDNYEYLRGKIAERGALTAKFSKDGFDRWAENTYPARAGQVEKVPTEMPTTTESRDGGKMCKKYMSRQNKMRHCRCSDDESESMCGGKKSYYISKSELNDRFYIVDRKNPSRPKGYDTEAEAQAALELLGGSFLSTLKKGAKTVGKYAKKAAKFVVKHKDTIKKGVELAREYAPVVRDVYKAAKSKEGRKALLDAALGAHGENKDELEEDLQEVEGGRQMTPLEYQMELESRGGSFLSALKKGAKTVGKYAKKAAKFVVKHKDTIKKGVELAREYAPVVRDVYKAAKSKEGRKALLDAALGPHGENKDELEEDLQEVEGGAMEKKFFVIGPHDDGTYSIVGPGVVYSGYKTEGQAQRQAMSFTAGYRGGSFLSALKKGAKTVGKYAKKAAKFVVKHKDTIKKGVELAREYAPVVRDVYKASKSKEGRKALLDAALGKQEQPEGEDGEDENEGGKRGKKRSARGAIVSKVMREMGLSLPQASKYVKEKGLY